MVQIIKKNQENNQESMCSKSQNPLCHNNHFLYA